MAKNNTQQKDRSKSMRRIGPNLNFASNEAYNLLRTNLSFSLPDKIGGKIIGITSSSPQDGKSTTSINLSYALAEAGHKVILIDSDMRRPSISKVLNEPMSPGLSNVLAGDDDKNAIRAGVLHKNLSVLFAGDIPPNPSELVSSEKMRHTLEALQAEYDYVIIDLPPTNLVSDPLAVSKFVDGIIVVVRHEKTKKKEILETIRQLKFVGVRILGFVYNGYKRGKGHYYSSDTYYKKPSSQKTK